MPDSKAMLAVKVEEKGKGIDAHIGQIVTIEVADVKMESLARGAGGNHEVVAASPDCKRLLFTAQSAGVGDGALPPKEFQSALYELDVDTLRLRKVGGIDRKVHTARFSPSGKRVLLVTDLKDGFLGERHNLVVADAALGQLTTIAHDAYAPLVNIGDNAAVPGWLDEDTIYYFSKVSVYGQNGQAVRMRHVTVSGKENRDVQPDVDVAVTTLVEERAARLRLKK
jgi:dipeptidyl aminopeptidase/acylaminoacyl peptidase